MRAITHSIRRCAGSPCSSCAIVLFLALALGQTVAVAIITKGFLLDALPYDEPSKLVEIQGVVTRLPLRMTEGGLELSAPVRIPELADARTLEAVGMYLPTGLNVGRDRPAWLQGAAVTPGFFAVFRARPIIGRTFNDPPFGTNDRNIVISARLWEQSFHADPAVAGRTVDVNQTPFTIVGVMPHTFDFPAGSDVWLPTAADAQVATQVAVPAFVARLARGATTASAEHEILARISNGALTGQDATNPNLKVVPLHEALVAPIRAPLWLVFAAVLALLIVACVNSSILLLLRVQARSREFAMQLALGATHRLIVASIVSEVGVLVVAAALSAVPVSIITIACVRSFMSAPSAQMSSITAMAGGWWILPILSCLSVSAVGMAPIVAIISRQNLSLRDALTSDSASVRMRGLLVTVQISTALVLISTAVLVLRTVDRLQRVDMGAMNGDAVIADITLPAATYRTSAEHAAFYDHVREQLQSTPGIAVAGVTSHLPGSHTVTPSIPIRMQDLPEDVSKAAARIPVSPGYFKSIGIDLLAGRDFSDGDGPEMPVVAVVSEGCGRQFGLIAKDMVGRRINVGLGENRWATIAGVVRDVRMQGPESDPGATIYIPFNQTSVNAAATIVVRAAHRGNIVSAIRDAVARVDPHLPLYNVRQFEEIRAGYLKNRRFVTAMAGAFGAITFCLAFIGLYAVLSYVVQLRTREIGIRMAIGASPFAVQRQVVAAAARHAAAGVIVGAILWPVVSKVVLANVPGIDSRSGLQTLLLSIILFGAATCAGVAPAARASRIEPAITLRSE